jgi:hypothetical protein
MTDLDDIDFTNDELTADNEEKINLINNEKNIQHNNPNQNGDNNESDLDTFLQLLSLYQKSQPINHKIDPQTLTKPLPTTDSIQYNNLPDVLSALKKDPDVNTIWLNSNINSVEIAPEQQFCNFIRFFQWVLIKIGVKISTIGELWSILHHILPQQTQNQQLERIWHDLVAKKKGE